ncbi:hypothetical protein [Salipaludibacillus aurantiacus]|uniref:Uncharacterized protein n=1 Tax=Salipaludibacillus aurantiacus TaxID=1601833 RepID=A0A1H9Q9T5_9BACI|nr:hypothetical protein [Salipaludibacillus aurantiacus]SER57162.1 hypothetical protein SAMN05518684_102102 [Salipaludibacillus aurantiacus]
MGVGPGKGKKITGALSGLAGLYVVYAFLTGALLFQFNEPADGNVKSSDIDRFYGNEHANDRVVLLEDRQESGLGRIYLIGI